MAGRRKLEVVKLLRRLRLRELRGIAGEVARIDLVEPLHANEVIAFKLRHCQLMGMLSFGRMYRKL